LKSEERSVMAEYRTVEPAALERFTQRVFE